MRKNSSLERRVYYDDRNSQEQLSGTNHQQYSGNGKGLSGRKYSVIIWTHKAFICDTKYNELCERIKEDVQVIVQFGLHLTVWHCFILKKTTFHFFNSFSEPTSWIGVTDPEHISKSRIADDYGQLEDMD